VYALPLGVAAEQSVHYFWDYFSFFSGTHAFLQEQGLYSGQIEIGTAIWDNLTF
jgi:hypothetical protein